MLGGSVTINDNLTVTLSAPGAGYTGSAMPGILFYLPTDYYDGNVDERLDPSGCGDVQQELKINGNSASTFSGTILAPCSDIQLEGTSDTLILNSQVIGWNVNLGGNNGTYVYYDNNVNGLNPGYITLCR
jgi:hypothetical protein